MALSVLDLSLNSSDGFTSLQDILQAFNSSISEEQAWAVFFQSVQFLISNCGQDSYRDIYYYGNSAIRLSKEGDVKINVEFAQGSARQRSSFSLKKEFKTVISGPDVLEALGTAIYKALDYGLSASEEVHLSPELEDLIEFLIEPPATDDDEGIDIERDVEDNPEKDQAAFKEIADRCTNHVHGQQNVSQHYRAVCRALATEALELATFLDNIARERQLLGDDEKDVLEESLNELQRGDWARLWIQIMQQLRHGVHLKKVEHVPCQPLDYELTPFEMLLEDIRSRRYKLRHIIVNGDIPQKTKNDAHAVILDFIRSRPSLKPVDKRVLKKRAPQIMNPRELLLEDIKKPQNLKPVRPRNLTLRQRRFPFDSDVSSDEDSPKPQRKVIKPVAAFQVSTDDSDSYLSESDSEGRHHVQGPVLSPLTPVYPDPDNGMWKRAAARDMMVQPNTCRALGRRHTISACDAKNGAKVPQHAPVVEEEDFVEPDVKKHSSREHVSRQSTKLVSYRRKHDGQKHVTEHDHGVVNRTGATNTDHKTASKPVHAGHHVMSRSHGNLVNDQPLQLSHSDSHDLSSGDLSRSVSSSSLSQRSNSPVTCRHTGRSQSPARQLTRSETFSYSIPQNSVNCVHRDIHISTRSSSPQTRHFSRSESFPNPQHSSVQVIQRAESPRRHSVHSRTDNTHVSHSDTHPNRPRYAHDTESSRRHARKHAVNVVKHETSEKIVRRHSVHHGHEHSLSNTQLSSGRTSRSRPVVRRYTKPEQTQPDVQDTGSMHVPRSVHDRSTTEYRRQAWLSHSQSEQESNGTRSRSQSPSIRKSAPMTSLKSSESLSNSLQDVTPTNESDDTETSRESTSEALRKAKLAIIRARSRPDLRSSQNPQTAEEEKRFKMIEGRLLKTKQRSVSAVDFTKSSSSSWRSEKQLTQAAERVQRRQEVLKKRDESIERKSRESSDLSDAKTGQNLTRTELKSKLLTNMAVMSIESDRQPAASSARWRDSIGQEKSKTRTESNETGRRSAVKFEDRIVRARDRPLTPSRSENKSPSVLVRSRSEDNLNPEAKPSGPIKGLHELSLELEKRISQNGRRTPTEDLSTSLKSDRVTFNAVDYEENEEVDFFDSSVPDVIKTSRSEFKVNDLLHVSWKSECQRTSPSTNQPNSCSECRTLPHKWQNPIECLSLTLEEVSHIRMVLTKAELESQATDPELYQQLAKGKICFTCKKTKFSIFSLEWGTKCKFCRRNVCNYCLRKMNVPTEHFGKIPVYTLSPVPISPKVLDALKVYESTGSVPHSPVSERKVTPGNSDKSADDILSGSTADDRRTVTRRKSLQRSHTIGVGVDNRPPPNKALLKGPQMSICCDCKTMIMEIIRASRSDVALVPKKTMANPSSPRAEEKSKRTTTPSSERPSNLDIVRKVRPKSLLANFNLRSFSPNDMESDA